MLNLLAFTSSPLQVVPIVKLSGSLCVDADKLKSQTDVCACVFFCLCVCVCV